MFDVADEHFLVTSMNNFKKCLINDKCLTEESIATFCYCFFYYY